MSPTKGQCHQQYWPNSDSQWNLYGQIVLTKNTNMKINKQEDFFSITMPGIVAKTDPWKIFTFNTKEGPQDIV